MIPILLRGRALQSNVLLAPMSGYTDLPFRKMVRKFGPFLMYCEMVASQALVRNAQKSKIMLDTNGDEYTAVQLVGADPQAMADSAKLCQDLGAKIIDINMGCPVRKVVKTFAGSALMQNETLALQIISSVVRAVSLPVTLKIRLGWDDQHLNALSIAQKAQDEGIQMISVHARTRAQLYSGNARWNLVRPIATSLRIPTIINGDITDLTSAQNAIQQSQAAGIMIGRGSLGRPWILRQIDDGLNGHEILKITSQIKKQIAQEHVTAVFEYYKSYTSALALAKKTAVSYIHGAYDAARHRANLFQANIQSCEELIQYIRQIDWPE